MVMQARKCIRLNDGYYDKKSSNHHYEDSMNLSKYPSKSVNNYNNCTDLSYNKHNNSRNGSNSHSRSGSPDNWSPNRSVYANKSSYSRRSKERERETKYYDNINKKKISSRSSRSPVSHNKSVNNCYSRNSDNHDMNDSKCSLNTSKRIHIGEWTEHMSSNAKKYYYNSRTEVSQWEKPKEWLEWERKHQNKSERHSTQYFRDNKNDKLCVNTTNIKTYNNELSTGNRDKDMSRTKLSSGSGSNSNISNISNRSHSKKDDEYKSSNDRSNDDSKRLQQTESRNNSNSVSVKREDESPIGSSNECSITNISNKLNSVNNNNNINIQTNDKMRTQGITNINSNCNTNNGNNSINNINVNSHNNNISGVLNLVNPQTLQLLSSPSQTSNLPKILSQLSTQGIDLTELSKLSNEEMLRTLQQALQLTEKVKECQVKTASHNIQQLSRERIRISPRNTVIGGNSESPQPLGHHRHHHHIHHNHYHHQQHHQSADGIRQELDLLISRGHINKSPVSEKSAISSTRHESPPQSVTNISAISSASLKPSVPTLTPSLANYFKEDLISHVTGWQADHAEKQANKYSDESHDIGSHLCTRVSAELKMARSLVRLTEIQSTLQEQRILFATQQIRNVEEWKGHSHSYHS